MSSHCHKYPECGCPKDVGVKCGITEEQAKEYEHRKEGERKYFKGFDYDVIMEALKSEAKAEFKQETFKPYRPFEVHTNKNGKKVKRYL